MIILDTNIVSALMRTPIDPPIVAWMQRQRGEPLAVTVVTLMEVVHGLERLPNGRRRLDLEAALERLVTPPRGMRVLDLDAPAARAAAMFLARRDAMRAPAEESDMMIAGIAARAGATIATRNVRDFVGLPIRVVNPY